MGEARVGAGAAPGEPHSREVRIRKGGRGAGQLYMHLEETEEKARGRIISAAHRSTLTPPLVLAKPVTAGPTPCGPSFTPAPIPNPPSSPSTLVILTPAPTPLPFPPPPTPTDGGPAPTKTQPSPYPSPCLPPTAPPYDPEEIPHGTKKKGVGQSIIWRVRK